MRVTIPNAFFVGLPAAVGRLRGAAPLSPKRNRRGRGSVAARPAPAPPASIRLPPPLPRLADGQGFRTGSEPGLYRHISQGAPRVAIQLTFCKLPIILVWYLTNGVKRYVGEQKNQPNHTSVGAWTKRCYLAGRALMDATLRPYDLGATQWYVLWHLANAGPTMQRELVRALGIERATLSGIIATLVRKGLIRQAADSTDQRQRLLTLTASGKKLWDKLPDLTFIHKVAFDGIDEDAIATTIRVLRTATERLDNFSRKGVHI